jgi:phosphate transport system permease protein
MLIVCVIGVCVLVAFSLGRYRAFQAAGAAGGIRYLHSLPNYYGWYAFWVTLLPVAVFMLFWSLAEPWVIRYLTLGYFASLFPIDQTGMSTDLLYSQIIVEKPLDISHLSYAGPLTQTSDYYVQLGDISQRAYFWVMGALITIFMTMSLRQISAKFGARSRVERMIRGLLLLCSTLAILTTLGIVLSVVFESMRFFHQVPVSEFLLGTHWSPQIAIRADQQGSSGEFGAVPLFVGTLLITLIAMCVAAPVGIFSAIYLSEYAPEKMRGYIKPIMEILAGIPTVVYGFFAALSVAPAIRRLAESLGSQSVSSESALAAGVVMGVMIIPFVSSLSDDVIRAVPRDLRDASLAMGATRSETIRLVVLPAALPGIVGGMLLAISRAIGETMIVVMAAGLAANLTANPLASVTTITVQIVTLLIGDQEFDSAKTLAAFALGLTLFIVTLFLNIAALQIVKKYREQYE